MQNVPWHVEVREFAKAICAKLGNDSYGLACEHAHSCCTLLAKTSYRINGKWHTWIDYEKFHSLMEKYYEDGTEFTASDYWAETPSVSFFFFYEFTILIQT
jgi:tRNA wybutosine-synthesizing protein 1